MSPKIKHLFLSIISGIALGISWPVDGLTVLVFTSLIPLLYLEDSIRNDDSNNKGIRIFGYSYLSFLIWNIITTWWLYNSTLFGMLFANLCNSLFYALIFILFYWAKSRLPFRSAYIFFISIWIAFEKLHLIWDFSWSWLNLGNVFSEKIYWIQWYEYTGTFGGSLWVLCINVWIFSLLKRYGFNSIKLLIKKLIAPLIAIALPIAFSLYLYQKVEVKNKKIEVITMQPNIDPYNSKYNLTNKNLLNQFFTQLKPHLKKSTDYVLAPETYFSEGYGEELISFQKSKIHNEIQKRLADFPNTQIISGIQFYDTYEDEYAPTLTSNYIRKNLWIEYYNSALSEQYQKDIEVYHKSKLVVGVENMPFKKILKPLLGEFLIDMGGTVASRMIQKKRSVFSHSFNQEKAAPVICWESIFGEFVTGYVNEGATFLAVISNDAWWGETPGHKQLISYTRLRAIENRRDIVRSANTGISAIIDARGEIIKKTRYDTKTLLTGNISSRSKLTFYTRYGDIIARWSILIAIIYFLLAISGRLRDKAI
ncbi:MAG: apolipoprotein N-acyltransferase [Flavobacteriaceae bacterium]|nr:apolipoprotein N-acyltransferase [Flavobacteriaceae bacterium]